MTEEGAGMTEEKTSRMIRDKNKVGSLAVIAIYEIASSLYSSQ
jgi:hypothetical protein